MRTYRHLLATHANVGIHKGLKPAPLALLPPIPLYRRLLRAHRSLDKQMRLLGDEYVKSEFRAHRNVENPIHIVRTFAYMDIESAREIHLSLSIIAWFIG